MKKFTIAISHYNHTTLCDKSGFTVLCQKLEWQFAAPTFNTNNMTTPIYSPYVDSVDVVHGGNKHTSVCSERWQESDPSQSAYANDIKTVHCSDCKKHKHSKHASITMFNYVWKHRKHLKFSQRTQNMKMFLPLNIPSCSKSGNHLRLPCCLFQMTICLCSLCTKGLFHIYVIKDRKCHLLLTQ